jgi:membrane protease YdiL (CAAX protease family)
MDSTTGPTFVSEPHEPSHAEAETSYLPGFEPSLQQPNELPPAAQPRTAAHRIFMGPFGMRAGWGLLIYFALLFSILFTVRIVHDHYKTKARQAAAAALASGKSASAAAPIKHDPLAPIPVGDISIQEGIVFAALLIISLVMAAIERRRVSAFGLGGSHVFGRFATGAAWGLTALSLLILTLRSLHLLSFDAQLDHGWAILGWGAAQLIAFLLVGLVEEYLFRGYLQFTLMRGLIGAGNLISRPHARSIAFWIATVITSALFFAAHLGNEGEDKVGLLLVFLAGVVFVVALWRTGSLWWGIGFHTAWDWSQSYLYGVPDSGTLMQGRLFATHAMGNPLLSGGSDGPEGSVFCIAVLLLIIVVLFFTRPSPQPALETRIASSINANDSAEGRISPLGIDTSAQVS